MTKQERNKLRCPKCGTEISPRTEFSQWINALPYPHNANNFSCQNLDFIWFQYRDGWLVTIEEKRYGAESDPSQKDTHNIIAQMLHLSSGKSFDTLRKRRPIHYRGHHTVVFEKTTPDNSAWVKIDGKKYDNPKPIVMELLTKGYIGETKIIELTPETTAFTERAVNEWVASLTDDRILKLAKLLLNTLEERVQRKSA